MTRREQAFVKRLEKRNDELFSALCIIKTWLSFLDGEALWFQIAALCERRIQAEKEARRKESEAAK